MCSKNAAKKLFLTPTFFLRWGASSIKSNHLGHCTDVRPVSAVIGLMCLPQGSSSACGSREQRGLRTSQIRSMIKDFGTRVKS